MPRLVQMPLAKPIFLRHAWRMEDLALSVRQARPEDAADLARIYIESWQDTYAGVISHALLGAMSHKGHTARWQTAIKNAERNSGAVLVAEDASHGVIG